VGELDLSDIQGLIVRGYRMPTVRHLLMRIDRREPFKRCLAGVATAHDAPGPYVTSAADWSEQPWVHDKPRHCVNLGLTFAGLRALGLPSETLESFPEEFVQGSAARAGLIGDTGPSAPERWKPWLASPEVHALVSIFAQDEEELDRITTVVVGLAAGAASELTRLDGRTLPGDTVHFGYRDGISQPTIAGIPPGPLRDPLPAAPAGAFLLGHPSQHPGFAYPVPVPEALGRNGSFAAFRVLEQDAAGFERFLREQAPALGMSPERLAAKLCGRWRSGAPLVMAPIADEPVATERLNDFDYAASEAQPAFEDPRGERCPLGAHIRRANPRSGRVAGNSGHSHRLIRRGVPYGPPLDPDAPDDGRERGLLGLFIAASLRDQFEFVMREWLNDGAFAPGLGRTRDPLVGANDPADSRFVIRGSPTVVVTGLPRFVTTRGSVYCFLPSLTGLRHLAGVG